MSSDLGDLVPVFRVRRRTKLPLHVESDRDETKVRAYCGLVVLLADVEHTSVRPEILGRVRVCLLCRRQTPKVHEVRSTSPASSESAE